MKYPFLIKRNSLIRHLFVLFALLSFCLTSQAAVYYFSSSTGNDANTSTQAQNQATPWKSINKLNSFFGSILPGDQILFKRGDEFYGTITITKSGSSGRPIFFGAYGSGAKPVITGFTTLTGWTNEGGGIYSKVISSAAQSNMVTINDVQYAMGRYPDAAFLSYETFVTNLSITDNTLGTTTNWTGAEAAIKKNEWTIDRCKINSHSGNTLNYTSLGSNKPGTAKYGYFIQNDLRTLTTYGEWYHNTTSGKFYMYFGTISPTTKSVKVATVNHLLNNNSAYHYITVDNINFTGSISHIANYNAGNDYCTVQNCDLSFAGESGVYFNYGGTFNTVNNNTIRYCNHTGVFEPGSSGTINNNTILNIGNIIGQAKGADGYDGVYILGNGTSARYNVLRNMGYNGFRVKATGSALIQYNYIDTVCTLFDDGGGIYTAGPNTTTGIRTFDHNIILNAIGSSDGTDNNVPLSVGIFMDDGGAGVVITNNTLAFSPYAGMKLHRANNNTLSGNTIYDNAIGLDFQDWIGNYVRNNTIERNIFFSKTTAQFPITMRSVTNDLNQFGTANNNYYLRPIDDNLVFKLNQPSTGQFFATLDGWKTFSKQDANSKKSPKTITNVNQLNFQFNASNSPKVVSFAGLSYMDATGAVYNNSVTIPAWESKVLIANGTALTTNKAPTANAGTDKTITLPTNTVTLTGSGTDTDGTISSYAWSKVSGPTTGTIASPGVATTLINNLVQGIYQFELTVSDNNGSTGKDIVQVIVNSSGNVAPTANAGADKSITLPTNTITVSGSATDIDGTISSYSWAKISGPASGTIATPTVVNTVINNLVEGVYQFELSASDNNGAVGKDIVIVTVNAASGITLLPAVNPANTVNGLDYKYYEGDWNFIPAFETLNPVKLGIANNFDLNLANQSTLYAFSFTGYINVPVDGQYTFYTSSDDGSRLYIDDVLTVNNDGVHGTIERSGTIGLKAGKHAITGMFFQKTGGEVFIVSYQGTGIAKQTIPASALYRINNTPDVNAGNNQSITLPTSSVTLSGIADDTDGSISSYSWAKISGPSNGTIVSPNAASTSVNNLVEGVYEFVLVVTDNNGGIGKDTVLVYVNAALGITLLPAVNPANTTNGLDYKYYEGSWSLLPSFTSLSPIKAGTVANFDLTLANRSTQYGFSFTGFINVPADGQYTFYTSSDDGSSLYIDNVLTVNNDGEHAVIERSGTIGLKAGKHAITALFFQQAGGAVFTVSYQSNTIAKQIIPTSQLFRIVTAPEISLLPAVNPANTINGLDYKYYEGNWSVLPAFNSLSPIKTGSVANFDLSPANRSLQYGFNFTGYINVPADGQYTFYTTSDDGSSLYIDNILTVNNDGIHSSIERSGTIGLKAGKHAIAGLFFQQAGGAVFSVSYQSNSIAKQTIPGSQLYRINPTIAARISGGNTAGTPIITQLNVINEPTTLKISCFPNPSNFEFGLLVEGGSNEKVEISIMDIQGKRVFHTTGATNNKFKFGNKLLPGIYIVKVIQGNSIKTIKVIKL